MPNISGAFTATVTMQTVLSCNDQPNHDLALAELHATQKSPDPDWNNCRLTYSSIADIANGQGKQHGYYVNEHADGSRDMGSFEGRIKMSGNEMTSEGTFTINSGTGKFQGIRGSGTWKARNVSPTQIEMSWSGSYEIAAKAGHAA